MKCAGCGNPIADMASVEVLAFLYRSGGIAFGMKKELWPKRVSVSWLPFDHASCATTWFANWLASGGVIPE